MKNNLEMSNKLAKDSKFLFSIFSEAKVPIGISLDGMHIFTNKAYLDLFGYNSFDELKNIPILQLIAPSEHDRIRTYLKKRTKGEDAPWDYESIGLKKDGTEFPFNVKISSLMLDGLSYNTALFKDITKEKNAEKLLLDSENRFKTLYRTAPVALFRISLKDRSNLGANFAAAKLFGYSSIDDFIKNFKAENHYADIKDRAPILKELEEKGFIEKTLINSKKVNGELIWNEANFTVNKNENYIDCLSFDVTEKIETKKALEAKELFLKDIIDSMESGFSILNKDGKHLDVNPALCRMTGFKKEELIGVGPPHPYWPEEEYDSIQKAFEKTNKGNFESFELVFKKKNGKRFPVGVNPSRVIDKDENIISLFATITDISERKKAEEKLREKEKRLWAIFNNAGYAVSLAKNGIQLMINPTFIDLFGYTDESELVNVPLIDFIAPEERERIKKYALARSKGEKMPDHYETKGIKKDGSTFEMEIRVNTYEINGEIYTVGFQRDITKEKLADIEKSRLDLILEESGKLAKIGGWELDVETMKSYYSNETKRIYGIPLDSDPPPGIEGMKFYPKETQPIISKAVEDAIEKGKEYDIEVPFINAKGENLWVRTMGKPRIKNGKVVRLYGTLQDITDLESQRKKLNDAYLEISELKDRLQEENIYLRKKIKQGSLHKDFIGNSSLVNTAVAKALQVATSDTTVLLRGETGTGKELLARGIHNASMRKDKSLITINCAAIPDSLIESELFGHEAGAFTDSRSKKVGMFEVAEGSTLFLDEIGELPYNVQAKLLRVIDNKELYRIGGTKPIKVDVRIIGATNQNLEELIEDKKFRQDLYYRLNVFNIDLPPLRFRPEDIPILAEKFIAELNAHMGKNVLSVSKKDITALQKYSWPGNVRELKNVIERSMIASSKNKLIIDFPDNKDIHKVSLTKLEDVERNHITQVLESVYWKVSGKGGAAEILGMVPTTLRSRMLKLGIKKPI